MPAKPCGNSFAVLLDTNSEDTDRVAPRMRFVATFVFKLMRMGRDGDDSGREAGNALNSSTIDLRASLSSRPESGAHVRGATQAEKSKV